jgi:hypothetical protein
MRLRLYHWIAGNNPVPRYLAQRATKFVFEAQPHMPDIIYNVGSFVADF